MKIIEENGKRYELDDEGNVVYASLSEEEVDETPLAIGDRVEVEGRLGYLQGIAHTMYGDAYSVRFDNGDYEAYTSNQIKRSSLEPTINYDSPAEDIVAEWDKFLALPDYSYDQVEAKLAFGRQLRLRAKSIVTDSRLPLSTRTTLDQMVSAATAELTLLEESKNTVREADQAYLDSLPQFSTDELNPVTSTESDWLNDLSEEEITAAEVNLADLASRAVDSAPQEYLESADFLAQMTEFASQSVPEAQRDKVAGFIKNAAMLKINEVKPVVKEASAEEIDIESVDASDLYL